MYSVDCCPKGLVIGKQGENEAEKIAIDFSPWASEFGAGTISVRLRRPKDSAAYPVALITEGTTATWTISATDTQYAGAGSLQLVYIVGDVVAKSVIWPVRVLPSLEAGEAPEPYESWLDTLEGLAADTQGNARDAAASAADAAQSATSAAASAQDAAESAASITGLTAVAETLPEGSEASASFDGATDTLTLGIPKGDTGAAGPKGDTGSAGADGFSPSASVTKQDGDITITITDKDGTTSATLEVDDALDDTSDNPVQNQAIQNALWNLLPVDMASGSIASFPDGADDVPMLSLKAQIEPVQDLHGYDNPWPAGGGKNKFNPNSVTWKKWVLTSNVFKVASDSEASISFSVSGETISITTTSVYRGIGFAIDAVDYDRVVSITNSNIGLVILYSAYEDNATVINSGATSCLIPANTSGFIAIRVNSASTVSFNEQIESGSTASAWTPYSNECPISGHTGAQVEHAGANIWDEEWELNGARINSKNLIPVLPNTSYAWVSPVQPANGLRFYDANKTLLSTAYSVSNGVFTTPADCYYIWFALSSAYGATYNHDVSINYPSTDHDYHAYHGESIPVSWESEAGTVYGGEVDIVTGAMVDDMAIVDMGSLSWLSDSNRQGVFYATVANKALGQSADASVNKLVCSSYKYRNAVVTIEEDQYVSDYPSYGGKIVFARDSRFSDTASFKTAVSGVQLCYKLEQPQTYQLTPQEVRTFLGQNNIWNDCGDTEVTYRADIQKFIEKKVNA